MNVKAIVETVLGASSQEVYQLERHIDKAERIIAETYESPSFTSLVVTSKLREEIFQSIAFEDFEKAIKEDGTVHAFSLLATRELPASIHSIMSAILGEFGALSLYETFSTHKLYRLNTKKMSFVLKETYNF